jgi:hypothetical protein
MYLHLLLLPYIFLALEPTIFKLLVILFLSYPVKLSCMVISCNTNLHECLLPSVLYRSLKKVYLLLHPLFVIDMSRQ